MCVFNLKLAMALIRKVDISDCNWLIKLLGFLYWEFLTLFSDSRVWAELVRIDWWFVCLAWL